jgi:hypothetical protein
MFLVLGLDSMIKRYVPSHGMKRRISGHMQAVLPLMEVKHRQSNYQVPTKCKHSDETERMGVFELQMHKTVRWICLERAIWFSKSRYVLNGQFVTSLPSTETIICCLEFKQVWNKGSP